MDSIYLLSSGEYDDYTIHSIFYDKEIGEKAKSILASTIEGYNKGTVKLTEYPITSDVGAIYYTYWYGYDGFKSFIDKKYSIDSSGSFIDKCNENELEIKFRFLKKDTPHFKIEVSGHGFTEEEAKTNAKHNYDLVVEKWKKLLTV